MSEWIKLYLHLILYLNLNLISSYSPLNTLLLLLDKSIYLSLFHPSLDTFSLSSFPKNQLSEKSNLPSSPNFIFFLFHSESTLNSSHFKACRLSPRDTFKRRRGIPRMIFRPKFFNLALLLLPEEIFFNLTLNSRGISINARLRRIIFAN